MPRRDARKYPGLYFTQYFYKKHMQTERMYVRHTWLKNKICKITQLILCAHCVRFSYMLILDYGLQLWFVWHIENHSYPTVFDDITRILHLLNRHGDSAGQISIGQKGKRQKNKITPLKSFKHYDTA